LGFILPGRLGLGWSAVDLRLDAGLLRARRTLLGLALLSIYLRYGNGLLLPLIDRLLISHLLRPRGALFGLSHRALLLRRLLHYHLLLRLSGNLLPRRALFGLSLLPLMIDLSGGRRCGFLLLLDHRLLSLDAFLGLALLALRINLRGRLRGLLLRL
jgi:hypothetical protein